MAENVYANGNAIAGKAGGGKVIAAFPDVCLSPPSPPAGPIPVPYPDTSFSKDTKNGSKTVKINNKEVMLKNKSFYKTSPLGDEAATRSFGASVITHVITGKTYFSAWSMDVKFEGLNVPRHIDITTSNHASYPGSTPPFPNMEKQIAAAERAIAGKKCPCCKKPQHAQAGEPMNRDEWYEDNIRRETVPQREVWRRGEQISAAVTVESRLAKYRQLIDDASDSGRRRLGCSCYKQKPKTELLPKPPCDVFYRKDPADANRSTRIDAEWRKHKPAFDKKNGTPLYADQADPESEEAQLQRQGNHKVPKSAGGCPGNKKNDDNLQANHKLCQVCQDIDKRFSEFQ